MIDSTKRLAGRGETEAADAPERELGACDPERPCQLGKLPGQRPNARRAELLEHQDEVDRARELLGRGALCAGDSYPVAVRVTTGEAVDDRESVIAVRERINGAGDDG